MIKKNQLQHHVRELSCPFCNKFPELERLVGTSINNLFILKTINFLVIPDVAPLVEGHVLIISKNHYPCFGAMPPEHLREAVDIKRKMKQALTAGYRTPVFFEHGPVSSDGVAGSCVDHAHLHCLPTDKEFSFLIAPNHNRTEITSFTQLAKYTENGLSYLFYESREEDLSIYPLDSKNDDIPSQHLRYVAARTLSISEWNWRDIIKGPNYKDTIRPCILRTVETLRCSIIE
uniref:Diadenosine tetraphosphate (Ap4A) hydrolase n=1 Tax=Candidatus Kentrum sp. FM TaxID=2126340 RepID=A0A450S7W9_9GAMM|nr:MAG: Diadenosine tetraphosphate (Ap4A) hydrolase [Candidatus Kentron sp. FM]VFJ48031.1 MAG: Diadenosine tetraphosphate (Ap4A) hydrolase [Candidatus Kentron sp. FM]VFK07686.1 MAG: Diadenosine tetraphosphate (Ap4A) hydrolase [Candidatus Kentron sp. FM]